jgi:hypothetical protein
MILSATLLNERLFIYIGFSIYNVQILVAQITRIFNLIGFTLWSRFLYIDQSEVADFCPAFMV